MIASSYNKILFGVFWAVLSLFVIACSATPEVESVAYNTPTPEIENGGGEVSTPEAEVPTAEAEVSTPEVEVPTVEAEVSTPEAEVPTPEAEVPTAEAEVSTPEAEVPTTEAEVPTTEAEVPTAEAEVPTAEAEAPTTEAQMPTAEAQTPTTEAQMPTTEAQMPTAEAKMPTAEAQMPTAEAQMPTAEAQMPTAEVDDGGDVSTPEAQTPIPEREVLTPEANAGDGMIPVTDEPSFYYIDELAINIMESFPVQVSAVVRGNLADGCTELENISSTREGNTFELQVNINRNEEEMCTQMLRPFEENVSLDVAGLPAGEYTVKVAETMSTFTLEMDNTAENPNSNTPVLTLERTACFGTCPIYQIMVYADGRVEYEGDDFVDVTGAQRSDIGADTVANLVNQFVEAGYMEWNDAYTNRYVTDMPTVITSMTVDGQTKRIERYEGDDRAPIELARLENAIDKTVNSVQWTGQEPQDPDRVGLANFASEYCVEQGGVLAILRDENGWQFGMCTFPDGSECEEWAFLNGECAPGDSFGNTGEPSGEEHGALNDTQWLFSWGEVKGESFSPFASEPIRLNFDGDTINGNGSCNSFFGEYTIEGNSLTVGEMGVTAMACEEELMELERQFFEALQSVDAFSYDTDSLTLSLPNGALHFTANMPVEKTVFIGAEQVDCQGVVPQKCYLMKDNLEAEWEYFYDQIVGFEWKAGAEYELRVRIVPVENPPADASSVLYELIEVVNAVPVR